MGGLAQTCGLNGSELFARFSRQGADAGVIKIGGEFAQTLAFDLIDLLLLALQDLPLSWRGRRRMGL